MAASLSRARSASPILSFQRWPYCAPPGAAQTSLPFHKGRRAFLRSGADDATIFPGGLSMAKTTTAVCISADEQLRELFRAEEKANGEIIVLMKKSLNHRHSWESQSYPVVQNRFSLHLSLNAKGGARTFTNTIEQSGRPPEKVVALVHPRGGIVSWPLTAQMSPDLSPPHYALTKRSGVKAISIGSYSPSSCTLVYFIVVTSPGYVPGVGGINTTLLKFQKYWITVFHWFVPLASLNAGHSSSMGTSFARSRQTGVKIWLPFDGAWSFTEAEISEYMNWKTGHFTDARVEELLSYAGQQGEVVSAEAEEQLREMARMRIVGALPGRSTLEEWAASKSE